MTRERADRALARHRGDRDRIAASLLDLANRPGYPLLEGTRLEGVTARKAEELSATVRELWRLFDAYGQVVEAAQTTDELAELAALLTDPSVKIIDEQARPTLLGPVERSFTLQQAVTRMTRLFDTATRLVEDAHAAWEKIEDQLGRAGQACVRAKRQEIDDPRLDDLARSLEQAKAQAAHDPLTSPPGLNQLVTALEQTADRLTEAARARREHHRRTEALRRSLTLLAEHTAKIQQLHPVVQEKIANPPSPRTPDHAGLTARLKTLPPLGAQKRWAELADELSKLETECATALAAAVQDQELLQGLLDRRNELRGRCAAYGAKARRLGLSEKPEIVRLNDEVRRLLWSSPCDLRQATVALAALARALSPKAAP